MGTPWTVIVPVKPMRHAKSRMDPRRAGDGAALAAAFLGDVLAAASSCAAVHRVLVVTHDPEARVLARSLGAGTIDDKGHPGINAAALHAAASLGDDTSRAVVVSDLPCLSAGVLAVVLAATPTDRPAFVADAEGTGTTMLLAPAGTLLQPCFGAGSAAAHRGSGALDLVSAAGNPPLWRAARRDVDTAKALADAIELGVGPATAAACAVLPTAAG